MVRFIVSGGTRLRGEVRVGGAKNAALPILAASVMLGGSVELNDCPQISDVANMVRILETLGVRTCREGDTLRIDASHTDARALPELLTRELRSSIFLLGPMLSRFGCAVAAYPGGCEIGSRPVDLHLTGLKRLGVTVCEEDGRIRCEAGRLRGAEIRLQYPSVGATENLMMAATAAEGSTILFNAAREPEIVDLAAFLNGAGYEIVGAGTSVIGIRGGRTPHDTAHTILPDRIVAGTYLIAGAITRGSVTVENAVPAQLKPILDVLRRSGASVCECGNAVRVTADGRPGAIGTVETLPHPGFPTDLQAQLFALCSVADGTSRIKENVFENRFRHAEELRRMGGDNSITGRTAVIRGVRRLTGTDVTAHDLRGGAALVLAGLSAEGETVIGHAENIERGYERMQTALNTLGASVRREETGRTAQT